MTAAALKAYTAGVQAARRAYNSDMAVQNGLCSVCRTNQIKPKTRRCQTCSSLNRTESATP